MRVHSGGPPVAEFLAPQELREIVSKIAGEPALWSKSVRFDLTERFYSRLRFEGVDERAVELWLICWDIGQDTLLHDHGGSSGAFTVARGSLLEDFGTVGGTALRTRRHAAGDAAGFGADYLHNLVNVGTEPTVSIHAYSPPLRAMNFYCWLPTGMHHLREIPCDTPEPDATALEAEAAVLRGRTS
jgi:cysteine dioxygenase type I